MGALTGCLVFRQLDNFQISKRGPNLSQQEIVQRRITVPRKSKSNGEVVNNYIAHTKPQDRGLGGEPAIRRERKVLEMHNWCIDIDLRSGCAGNRWEQTQ